VVDVESDVKGVAPPLERADHQPLAPPPERTPRRSRSSLAGRLGLARFSALYLWAFFMVLFGLLQPDTFLTSTTLQLVFSQGVVTCLIALAFLIPLAAGVYDLSVGAVMALSLSIVIYLNLHSGLPTAVTAVIGIAACALVGGVSGFIVVKLRVNSFIGTLGVSQVLLAVVILISGNLQLVGRMPQSWSSIATSDVLGVPIVTVYLVIAAAIMWFVLEHTRIGRYLFATGGNADAARLAGIATDRTVWGSLIASGAVAGLAGVVYSMQNGVFSATIGPGYLFPAVAAVFLGASQFQQRPNVWGTLIAYFALAFGVQGLTLAASSASNWSQPLFQGVSLIVAVALASRPAYRRIRSRGDASASEDAS
jgi:ribose transport system permease protein